MNLESLKNKICIVEYKDATYSYVDLIKKKISMPKPIISIGKIRRVTNKLLDLGLVWSELKTDKYFYGLIIPKKSVISVSELFVNEKNGEKQK